MLAVGLAPNALDTTEARKRLSAREVHLFSNATQLGMGDDAPAQTSTIAVSGFDTPIADIAMTLVNISFGPANSHDMDILLIGPNGQTAMVLSDAGGNTATSGATIVLDDQATDHLPNHIGERGADNWQRQLPSAGRQGFERAGDGCTDQRQ